jgi:hypothetical protein
LGGSTENIMAGGPPLGVIYAINLTPGGPLPGWNDGEIVRAIRKGRRIDGSLVAEEVSWKNIGKTMSDADLRAVQAYLKMLL